MGFPYHYVTMSPHHHITAWDFPTTTSLHHCVTVWDFPTTVSWHHHISQSFALPPATKPVSNLPCPCHQTSQSFDLPSTTMSLCHHITAWDFPTTVSPCHHITTSLHEISLPPHHRITVSLYEISLPLCCGITTLGSHLPCPLSPNQSVIYLAHYHQTSQSFALPPCHQTSQSFDLPSTTASPHHFHCITVSLHEISLPLHHCITASLHHCITAWDFPHHIGMNLIG